MEVILSIYIPSYRRWIVCGVAESKFDNVRAVLWSNLFTDDGVLVLLLLLSNKVDGDFDDMSTLLQSYPTHRCRREPGIHELVNISFGYCI